MYNAKLKGNKEYEEYLQYERELADQLEAQWSMAEYNHDLAGQYKVLGQMMAYKVIDPDDPRIEKNNKSYKKADISSKHRFRLDYRREIGKDGYMGYIPEWVYGDIAPRATTVINTIEHQGKRVEGNYEGDVIFKSFGLTIGASLCGTTRLVENAFEVIERNYAKALGQAKKFTGELEFCKEGIHRVINLKVESPCLNGLETLGQCVIRMDDDCYTASLILNYDNIINLWLPLDETLKNLEEVIKRMVSSDAVKFKYVIDPERARAKQHQH